MKIINSSTNFSIKSLNTEFDLKEFSANNPAKIKSVSDALFDSLNNFGKVDIDYMSIITRKDQSKVIKKLGDAIFQNPEKWNENPYRGWEISDEYLSGNLFEKLKIAREANKKYNGLFIKNVRALKKLMPAPIKSEEIFVSLGSPWLPNDIVDDFISHLFNQDNNLPQALFSCQFSVQYDEYSGKWKIPYKNRFNDTVASVAVFSTYGTERLNALHIIEKTLNNRAILIQDNTIDPTTSKSIRTTNYEETALAIEKQKKITKEFQGWIWTDENRKKRLEQIYSENFVYIRQRHYDGSFLTFPDMNKDIELYPHQKNAVARIIFSGNTLLAHEVGTGKTYTMIAAGMEMRRMGLSKKNLFVVPNNIIGEWERAFKKLYPNSNVYCVSSTNCKTQNFNQVMQYIKDNDFDAIIMTYTIFDDIKCMKEKIIRELEDKYQFLISKKLTKANLKEIKEIESQIDEEKATIYFEDLDIDTMFVDEAHKYKNLRTEQTRLNIIGMSQTGAQKCDRMLEKVRYLDSKTDGRGVVFATGTPLSNSIVDIYVMQYYLQYHELESRHLNTLNSWINTFSAKSHNIIVDVDTSRCKDSNRYSNFANIPELTKMTSQFLDFHAADNAVDLPRFDGYTDILIPHTPNLRSFLGEISQRVDKIRSGKFNKSQDNMFLITTDGRKAALDLRLVDEAAEKSNIYKLNRCAEFVHETYRKHHANRCTQIVFCDISVPKAEFNVYDELRYLLIDMGIPGNEIAFIHDAATPKKRNEIFKKFRKGEIRVLIGSTDKLGTGVNVQDKLVAIHHLDVPWKPSDIVQREGRILRQGNTNEKIEIFRYITEGSFDAYSWQILEQKQKFISNFLSGFCNERTASNIGDIVLNYAEIKTLALNQADMKLRFETENQLNKYLALQKATEESCYKLQAKMAEAEEQIAKNEKEIETIDYDYKSYISNKSPYTESQTEYMNKIIAVALERNDMHPEEKTILIFHGFRVVLPANMSCDNPYILLKSNGTYKIELKKNETNAMKKINRYLESLGKKQKRLSSENAKNSELISQIKKELANQEDYTEIIENLSDMLAKVEKGMIIR